MDQTDAGNGAMGLLAKVDLGAAGATTVGGLRAGASWAVAPTIIHIDITILVKLRMEADPITPRPLCRCWIPPPLVGA